MTDLPRVPGGAWTEHVPDQDVRDAIDLVLAAAERRTTTFDDALVRSWVKTRLDVTEQTLREGVVRPATVRRLRTLGVLIRSIASDRHVA